MNPELILAVGPRELPQDGWAEIWIDSGAGPGYTWRVRTGLLALATIDDGQGESAIYALAIPGADQNFPISGQQVRRQPTKISPRGSDQPI